MKRYVLLQMQASGNIRKFQVRSVAFTSEYFVIRAQGNKMKSLVFHMKGCQVGAIDAILLSRCS